MTESEAWGAIARSDAETRPWPRKRAERFLRALVQLDRGMRDPGGANREHELAAVCGAGHGARSPNRENQRNHYRPRQRG